MDLTSWADNVDWECMAGTNGKGREGGVPVAMICLAQVMSRNVTMGKISYHWYFIMLQFAF